MLQCNHKQAWIDSLVNQALITTSVFIWPGLTPFHSCVKNLGASYIRAIAETASFHQIETLREAFWNYLALKASLKVKICAIGFKTLSLEINMPYLALRHFSTPSSDRLGKPTRKRIDLSFLNIPTHANDGNGTYGLQEAHVSLSIIGVDHYNWTDRKSVV